jgi:peptidoglycan/LPS O-acetylase OafA/YrhL
MEGRTLTSAATQSRLDYRPELDGVRAFAVLAVMLLHSWPFLPTLHVAGRAYNYLGGFLGVDVFFVLSGYLITTLLLREERARGTIRLGAFYARRALRLLPALFVALVLAAAVVAIIGRNPASNRPYAESAFVTLAYVANWFQARESLGILNHTWSLAIEEQYYLVWPAVLLLATRFVRSKRAIAILLLAAAGAIAILRFLVFDAGHHELAALSTVTRGDGVVIGSALAVALSTETPRLRRVLERGSTPLVATLFIVVTSAFVAWNSPFLYRGGLLAVNLATAALIGHLAVRMHSLAKRFLSSRPLPTIGRISYGIYLFHVPINYLIHREPVGMTGPLSAVLMFVASIVFAFASYRVLEQPILRLKKRFGSVSGMPERDLREVAAT